MKKPKTDKLELNIHNMLDELLAVRNRHPVDQHVLLQAEQMHYLCASAAEMFLEQPMLLEFGAPVKLCGDVHGQYHDLLWIFEHGGYPPQANFRFLGDCRPRQAQPRDYTQKRF